MEIDWIWKDFLTLHILSLLQDTYISYLYIIHLSYIFLCFSIGFSPCLAPSGPQSDSSHARAARAARPPLHVLPRRRVQDVDLPAGALVQAGALQLATAAIGPGKPAGKPGRDRAIVMISN